MTTPPTPTDEAAALAHALEEIADACQPDDDGDLPTGEAIGHSWSVAIRALAAYRSLIRDSPPRGSLDAAWARVGRALSEDQYVLIYSPSRSQPVWRVRWMSDGMGLMDDESFTGPNPVAALTALAEALEAR